MGMLTSRFRKYEAFVLCMNMAAGFFADRISSALNLPSPPLPHLWTCALPWDSVSAASPRPEVEVTVHDGVHAGVGAGEEEESLLNPLVHRLCRSLVYPVPETLIQIQNVKPRLSST